MSKQNHDCYCYSCKELLTFEENSIEQRLYCLNEKCRRFGLLTVVSLKNNDKESS